MHHISFEMHVGKAHLGSGMSITSIYAKTLISTLAFDPYLFIFSCCSKDGFISEDTGGFSHCQNKYSKSNPEMKI